MSTVIELTPDGSAFHLQVAGRLRIGLSARGIKKGDVAKFIGMTPSSFSKRLHGHLVMDLCEIEQIASATGMVRDWLLTGSGPMLDPEWVRPKGFEPLTF
ncbi:XRE family transcriptional regulator [Arthrobacter sp. SLBN-53]|uniref:XRE family transcriptional regulator n=1 Tax=Arthrobacter sp. SLBN-53 TaxID=2768412 RepID=UPI001359FE8D|nr:XRE family transcriptional regulator [Arthrobacter sp. SLBN-53]